MKQNKTKELDLVCVKCIYTHNEESVLKWLLFLVEKTRKLIEPNFGSVNTNPLKKRMLLFAPDTFTIFAKLKLRRY